MIGIIDYGMGNIHSVAKALRNFGAKVCVTNKLSEIKKCDKIVLPGVGAFGAAMFELEKLRLDIAIKKHIDSGKIFLGICLGMHLLFDSSQESPRVRGLGIIPGTVKKFKVAKQRKVPHMGWNQLALKKKDCLLLRGIKENSSVYFCHSYYPQPEDKACIAATTEYGIGFSSIICKGNVFAMQFHPEKSQAVGLKIIENFVKL
jgi:glutamine amidotransferase